MLLKGAITALVTPMTEKGDLDFDSLENLINFQIESGISGIVAVGTTGESATIDLKDHMRLIESFVKISNKRIPIIAGTGANSTDEALTLTKSAESSGADAALLVSPYYNKPPQEGIYAHHMKIADESNLPQILYNVPSRTASFIESKTVSRLAKHQNIIGIKDATGEMENIETLKSLCKEEINNNNFSLFSGDDFSSLEFISKGGDGTISVSSNIVPKIVSDICKLAEKDFGAAKNLDDSLVELNRHLFVESNPIPVKWALFKMGMIKSGIRLPLVELNDNYKKPLEACLAKLNLI